MIFRKKISLGILSEWICITLLILLSGSSYFTLAYRKETTAFLVVFTLLYVGVRHIKIKKKQLIISIIITAVLIFNFTANIISMTTANMLDYGLIIVSSGCIALLSSGMSLNIFREKYIMIMDVIAVISLCCFYIQLSNKELVYQLGTSNLVKGYLISPFHTWGWTYIFERNAGPFWEPGAFQGYLFLAILFILNENNLRKYKKSLVVLMATVITTMSTTGYILLIIAVGYLAILYWKQSVKKSKDKALTILKVMGIIILAIVILKYISSSNVISNKLTYNNQSFSIRMLHLKYGMDVISQRMLLGYGISSLELMNVIKTYGMNSNSVGVFAILQYFGVVFGSVLVAWNFYRTCKVYENLNCFIIIIMFFVLHMTEGLLLYPIYMSFLFWNTNKKNENGEKQSEQDYNFGLHRAL